MEVDLKVSLMSCNANRVSGMEAFDALKKAASSFMNLFSTVPQGASTVKHDGKIIGYLQKDGNGKNWGLFTMGDRRVATIRGDVKAFPEKWQRYEVIHPQKPQNSLGSLLVETVPYPHDSQITRMQLDLNRCD